MADASGIPYEVLAWTAEWHLREDTLRAANDMIVNYHHSLPMSRLWGGGTLSSSDGQRFPTKGRSVTARALSRYFVDEGISTYTHVSDQLSTYGTKVTVATQPEATYVLDEILGNQTDAALVMEHWDDLLRLAASFKFGHATASLVVGKLSASGAQNTLAAALKEYGSLRRSIYAARYLSDEAYRRRIARQLNKGETPP